MAKIYTTERLTLKMADESDLPEIVQFVGRNRNHLKYWESERHEDYFSHDFQLQQIKHEQFEMEAGRLFKRWINLGNHIIGSIALNNIIRGAFQSCHLGYRMDASEQGNGYATESLKAVVDIAFRELHLHRIEANIMPRNRRSLRVVEKLGFKNEGISKEYLKINGEWEDHIHMVLLNETIEKESENGTENSMELTIKQVYSSDEIPMDLLLSADPSMDQIEKYLSESTIFAAVQDQEMVGVMVVSRLDESSLEIRNIAVYESFQGRGIGKKLVETAVQYARKANVLRIEVGTGNSSLGQLEFYQKCGFRIDGVWKGYFIHNYEEEIYENGIRCRDMIRLSIDL